MKLKADLKSSKGKLLLTILDDTTFKARYSKNEWKAEELDEILAYHQKLEDLKFEF